MNRAIIYIDIEDDITAIIGKIKASKEKIVALVPPKRAGVLQSAVNLKLLNRTAHSANKKLVIVTHSPALVALAGSASIPVAKNLHSKPELAERVAVEDETETVIDGADLPIGEHAKMGDGDKPLVKVRYGVETDEAIEQIEKNEDSSEAEVSSKRKKPQIKVPNFGSFRKKLFFGIFGAIALTILLVWAFVFAPAATIIVNASTSPQPISELTVNIGVDMTTDAAKNNLRVISKQLPAVDMQVTFTATGIKENKASGSVVFRNCQSSSAKSIPSGTILTSSGGLTYQTQTDVTVPGGIFDSGCTTPGVSPAVTITATKGGTEYNNSSTAVNLSVNGYAATMTARTTTALTGGDSKTTTVVSADDIKKAKEALMALPTDGYKNQLTKMFGTDQVTIPTSFEIQRAEGVSSPAQGEPATTATLTSKTIFSMYGANVSELDKFLDTKLAPIVAAQKNFKIYDNGAKNAKLGNFYKSGNNMTISLETTAKIGPSISESYVKELAKGKIYGEAQSTLSSIPGVQSVDIKFSYFWVTTVPNDENKIKVEFTIDDGK